jgi:hypothetical protein
MDGYEMITENPFEEMGEGIPIGEMRGMAPQRGPQQQFHVPQDMRREMKRQPRPPQQFNEEEIPRFIPPPQSHIQCRDVFNHVEDCPICSGFFKRDKYYYIVIAILVLIIFYLMHKNNAFGKGRY